MSSDVKAELASEILDYVWHEVMGETRVHSQYIDGQVEYFERPAKIWYKLYDIIDEVA